MTTNSQNLTFGEWLAQAGYGPERFRGESQFMREVLYDAWQTGSLPEDVDDSDLPTPMPRSKP